MFDKETLTALQESQSIAAASTALNAAGSTYDVAAMPSDYKLHNLEQYLPARRRARGTMTTTSLDSFACYTKAHAEDGASVFVNSDNMSATAILNLGTPDVPGHADDRANLDIKRTATFAAMLAVATGAGHKQSTIAEFLEDWPDQIKCCNEAGVISNAKAIAAVRKLTIESMRKLESEEQQLSASRSAFESVQATSKEPIPTIIEFKCQPYADLHERTFALRLAIRTEGDKPTISIRVIKAEQQNEEMSSELADRIIAAFESSNVGEFIPVLIGSYSKSE